jgi:type I restriction-modification system DNA methylase subunit/restriction endonuclease S subunit
MLNKETKKKIDNARNILVGVLPLPSDQIELITIALIYKFMDDQDEELRSVGQEEKFFVDELKDYSWQQLMSNQLSADQRVTKFINAIEEIQKSKHIPSLFKEIFTNTFLKFRDGRVLQLFLDKIDGFSYDHSEELGNAFEYLLMTMGAQGDNGQFRTPRNIIDFLVEVVNPTKHDSIIDPACGTGGFLVSAYKHILRSNTTGLENFRVNLNNYEIDGIPATLGDKLNATERKKLEQNVEGYDNTPLMVRLARVNLYLHHFTNPKIHEYDTLNYDTRWKEKFDCILANPPFMTPKGGIEPHDKFRIRAKRTEILFADYILEHLSPNGKAGFVVPEGIIFQGSGDFTELRKWMIYEAGLWAVVSLPAHIFQPYSGVKTSILLIDREVARTRSEILLVKIENDGFSLNTNRTPIKENDLPGALNWLDVCKKDLEHFKIEIENQTENTFTKKIRLLHKDEFARLDSYKSAASAFSFCRKLYNKTVKVNEDFETKIELEKAVKKEAKDKSKKEKCDANIAYLKDKIKTALADFYKKTGATFLPATEVDLKKWFDENLKEAAIEYGVNLKNTEVLTKPILDALDHERDYNLNFDKFSQTSLLSSEYELVSVGDLCELGRGRVISKETIDNNSGIYPVYSSQTSNDGIFGYIDSFDFDGEYVTWTTDGANAGTVFYRTGKFNCTNVCGTLKAKTNKVLMRYLAVVLNEVAPDFVVKLGNPKLMNNVMEKIQIPLPPIDIQIRIIFETEANEKVIKGCNEILENYKSSFEINPTWEKEKLGHILDFVSSGSTPLGGEEAYVSSDKGVLFIRSQNILTGFYDFTKAAYIPFDVHKKMKRSQVKFKDVFLNITGDSIGRSAMMNENTEANVNQHVALLRVKKDLILPEYLSISLNSPFIQSQIFSNQAGGTRKALNYEQIKDLIIPLPSLKIQSEIVDKIQDDFRTLEALRILKMNKKREITQLINKVFGR